MGTQVTVFKTAMTVGSIKTTTVVCNVARLIDNPSHAMKTNRSQR